MRAARCCRSRRAARILRRCGCLRLPPGKPGKGKLANQRDDPAPNGKPDCDVEWIVRRTGEDEDKSSPTGGRKCTGERSSTSIGRRAATNEESQRDRGRDGEGNHLP